MIKNEFKADKKQIKNLSTKRFFDVSHEKQYLVEA
jgi:hypothetical protein